MTRRAADISSRQYRALLEWNREAHRPSRTWAALLAKKLETDIADLDGIRAKRSPKALIAMARKVGQRVAHHRNTIEAQKLSSAREQSSIIKIADEFQRTFAQHQYDASRAPFSVLDDLSIAHQRLRMANQKRLDLAERAVSLKLWPARDPETRTLSVDERHDLLFMACNMLKGARGQLAVHAHDPIGLGKRGGSVESLAAFAENIGVTPTQAARALRNTFNEESLKAEHERLAEDIRAIRSKRRRPAKLSSRR